MYTGYITNQENEEVARDYEAAIIVWYKRLKSMYLPNSGFCLYPPEEGGARKPDTYCAPLGVKHLLTLPSVELSGIKQKALRELLDDIRVIVRYSTNYLTSQLNEEGRLYSTVDTAACLALMIGLREAGIVAGADAGRVALNGQEMSLAKALTYDGRVETLRCVEGVVAAQVTSEVI